MEGGTARRGPAVGGRRVSYSYCRSGPGGRVRPPGRRRPPEEAPVINGPTHLRGRRILVTGGSGTIGARLVDHLLDLEPDGRARLRSRRDEAVLPAPRGTAAANVRFLIGDIRDRDRCCGRARASTWCSTAPRSSTSNRASTTRSRRRRRTSSGTQNVIDACLAAGVETMILTSSDKAANPTSVMGASKLLAEKLVSAATNYRGTHPTTFASVRFGNVLGSRGSALELFARQIAAGGPVTVTDPAMTRFVMSTDRAVELAIQAAEIARGGEVFVFKMPAARLDDLIAAAIDVVAPAARPGPVGDRARADRAARRREGLRGADDRGRVDPRARHRRHVRGAARRSRSQPEVRRRVRGPAAGAGRRLSLRRRASRWTATTSGGSSPRRSTSEAAAAEVGRDEGPRHRRGRLHRPLGGRRAARARPRGPADRQPRRRRRRRTSTSSRGHPGLRAVRAWATSATPRACRRWTHGVDAVAHLAASISVQDSIDDPATTFENDVVGTFNVLEAARAVGARVLFMSTCMVYDRAATRDGHRRGPPDQARVAVRRVEAVGRGADAVLPPRLRPADDRRPAVQHVRPVPALGRRGRRRGDLHPALAARRGAADLRRRDADARPALRRGLRAVRRPTRCCPTPRPAGSSTPGPARRLGQRAGGARSSRTRRGSSTSTHIHPQSEIAVLRCDPRGRPSVLGWRAAGRPARRASPGSATGWRSGWPPASRSD